MSRERARRCLYARAHAYKRLCKQRRVIKSWKGEVRVRCVSLLLFYLSISFFSLCVFEFCLLFRFVLLRVFSVRVVLIRVREKERPKPLSR